MTDLIALSIPVLLLLIAVEWLIGRWSGRNVLRFNDAVANLSCGIGEQTVGVVFGAALLLSYAFVHTRFALFKVSADSPAAWAACFIGIDFLYYWWHRASHRINFFWAAHIVHHQSEDYNLTVALRQAFFTSLTVVPFYMPLAVLGFPFSLFVANLGLSTLYQFWIHTETIGKLGAAEAVLNTPSHHRVHHGINPAYIDRNYAAAFIVWDKLFGTFEAERELPVYGTVQPFSSWNGFWANFDYWQEIWKKAKSANSHWERIRIWWAPPEYSPDSHQVPPSAVDRRTFKKHESDAGPFVRSYVLTFLILTILGVLFLLYRQAALEWPLRLHLMAGILISVCSLGGLLDRRRWAWPLEGIRIVHLAWIAFQFVVPILNSEF